MNAKHKTDTKPVSLAEEKAAAKLEQVRETKPISAALYKDIQRVHEFKKIMRPMVAEIERIKAKAIKEMVNKGVDELTRKGIPVVSWDDSSSTSVDIDDIKSLFPEIAAMYVHTKPTKAINWKKPLD